MHIFTFVASVSSLISGDPYGYINVNNIAMMYTDVFNSSLGRDRGVSEFVHMYSQTLFWAHALFVCMYTYTLCILINKEKAVQTIDVL